jgi:hypothetical protein
MNKGEEYANVDTGQVWQIESFNWFTPGMYPQWVVMRWNEDPVTDMKYSGREFYKLMIPLPKGTKRVCYAKVNLKP